jgi:RNA 3'-terminal phosphate cyclase (ATP)
MLFSGNRAQVEVRGGTNNPLAPQVDYVERVMIPTLMKMGPKIVLHLQRRGFYPRGGGILTVQSEPVDTLNPISLTEFGDIKEIDGIAFSSRLPNHIVPRMIKTAQLFLEKADIWPIKVEQEILQKDSPKCALSPGCGIVLTATSSSGVVLGADELGNIKRPAEEVGRVTAENMIHVISQKVPVDAYLADQLLLYMALAKGRSTIRVAEVTQHMISCIYVCEQFLGPAFTISNKTGPVITINCDGVGFSMP